MVIINFDLFAAITEVKLLVPKWWKPLKLNPTYQVFLDRMNRTPEVATYRDTFGMFEDDVLDRIHKEKLVFEVHGTTKK